jgi:hypothetical protein
VAVMTLMMSPFLHDVGIVAQRTASIRGVK